MKKFNLVFIISVFVLTACAAPVASTAPTPNVCPVTLPPDPPFIPPAPHSAQAPSPSQAWYGTPALWTTIPTDGAWRGLPHDGQGYTQKLFWWHEGMTLGDEAKLTVTGRLVGSAESTLITLPATNASAADIHLAMLVGVDFPTQGCWEITGWYEAAEVKFVVLIQ